MTEEKKGKKGETMTEGKNTFDKLVKLDKQIGKIKTFVVGKIDSRKFFKEHGIDNKTLKKVAEVNSDFINEAVKFSTEKLISSNDVDKVITKVNTDLSRYVVRVSDKIRKGRNPQTGESMDIKGSLAIQGIIKPVLDKKLLEDCLKKIRS